MSAELEKMVAEARLDQQFTLVKGHWRSCRHLWLDTPEPLKVARLGPDLPPDFWFGTGLPGLADIRPTRNGRFEFAEDGRPALIVPAYDGLPSLLDATPERHVEELVDLVAVDLDHPDHFWLRHGQAVILGNGYLEVAGQELAPITVFSTPISWLRSGGAGIVVLDWNYARDLLLDRELIAENIALGTRLEAALAPSIWVMGVAA